MKQFQKVRVKKPQSSVFNLNHERKFTCNMGELVPVMLQEVIPGDHFSVDMEAMVRFQPLLAPIMHRINVYVHFFFTPYRLLWNNWEPFITGGKDGNADPVFPTFIGDMQSYYDEFFTNGNRWLADYLGFPVNQVYELYTAAQDEIVISQLPFRSYYQVWWDYFRDQNNDENVTYEDVFWKQAPSSFDTQLAINDALTVNLTTLRKRSWEKDYFTSALPTAQRGDEVLIPVDMVLEDPKLYSNTLSQFVASADVVTGSDGSISYGAGTDLDTEIRSEQAASATTINDLRRSFALQRWMEKNARGGARYTEVLLVHFGVVSSDARLQRAEYLGGGKMPVQISEVLQMSQTDVTAQGNLSGHGITGGNVTGFSRSFEEHGFIIGIMSIMPRTAYQQGLPRLFSKFDRFDYAWPEFAHIGEQEIWNSEIYLGNTLNDGTFGYQERFAEYRFAFDSVHGDLRSGVDGSLDFWHMANDYASRPSLNAAFVTCNPTTRIYPVEVENNQLVVQTYAKVNARRPLPKFGTPLP